MRIYILILTILLLSGSTSAECRDRDCMPNVREITDADRLDVNISGDFTVFYDSVFEIGDTWFVIFEYGTGHPGGILTFKFLSGPVKNTTLESSEDGMVEDSASFSGSIFADESPHEKIYINFTSTDQDSPSWSVELDIFVNKPPADDLFYLWGGMTVFWASIGAYVLYMSIKLKQLRDF
mgnify:CR=1 FL=1